MDHMNEVEVNAAEILVEIDKDEDIENENGTNQSPVENEIEQQSRLNIVSQVARGPDIVNFLSTLPATANADGKYFTINSKSCYCKIKTIW